MSLTSRIQALINYANETTEAGDTTLGDAVKTLCDGYGHGGGGIEEKDVNFFDYDGTLVASYTLAEAQALTELPQAPDHSSDAVPLTFDGWNWLLTEIKAFGRPCDVGAIYHPTDGKTHILCDYDKPTHVMLGLRSLSGTITYSIDWGDGETESGNLTTTIAQKTHIYTASGKYHVMITASNKYFIGGVTQSHFPCDYVFFSHNISQITGYNFLGAGMKAVTLPDGLTTISTNAFANNGYLTFIAIPRSLVVLSASSMTASDIEIISFHPLMTTLNNFFYQQTSLRRVILPDGITTLVAANNFTLVTKIKEIIYPSGVNTIGTPTNCASLGRIEIRGMNTESATNSFSYCYSLREISIPQGWVLRANCNLTQSYAMTREAFVDFFSHLGNGTATITLGFYNLAKLTDEDKAIATSKGYTLN